MEYSLSNSILPNNYKVIKNSCQEGHPDESVVWTVYYLEQKAGYVTLKWNSRYEPFRVKNIPEIIDLKVFPQFRSQGIGTFLLESAEQEARTRSDSIGLGVGLYSDYGNAQRLYVKRGYIPDGCGATYYYEAIVPGIEVQVDDLLLLWFTKQLR